MKKRRVIITGVAGFIGSHLAELFLNSGDSVLGIDNLNDYYPPKIKKFNLSLFQHHPSFQFLEVDILAHTRIIEIFNHFQPQIVVHCAARAGVRASILDPYLYAHVNVLGTQTLLEAGRKLQNLPHFILLSSSSVYGEQKKAPFKETFVPNPSSPYGASKYAMELMAEQYQRFFNLPISIVRPFSVYGPRGRFDMAPFLVIRAALRHKPFVQYGTNADNQRDWTYISDFAQGVYNLAQLESPSKFNVYNLGGARPVGIEDFLSTLKDLIKSKLCLDLQIISEPRSKVELPLTYAEITKARTTFAYKPQVAFKDGMENFMAYYIMNQNLYRSLM